MTSTWPQLLELLLRGDELEDDQAAALMQAWLAEELEPVQTGFSWQRCAPQLPACGAGGHGQGAARCFPLPCARPSLPLVDTCGTGGDGADSFNISTAAFTAAACGVVVAKHGNRSASGKVGSADVLEGLGLQLQAPLQQVVGALELAGITFLFAPGWHPALKSLAPLRKCLGVRTVFNLLGPLVNPLQPDAQVLGVATEDLLEPMAGALQLLGLSVLWWSMAMAVWMKPACRSQPIDGVGRRSSAPRSARSPALGLALQPIDALAGGDLACNQQILQAVLQGQGSQAQKDVVALNTALVLWSAGQVNSWADGVQQAHGCLASGSPAAIRAVSSSFDPCWGMIDTTSQ